MNEPTYIQRTRRAKMVSPNDLPIICCTRPGAWGNPFRVVKIGKKWAVKCDDSKENAEILTTWCHLDYDDKIEALKASVMCYKKKLFPYSYKGNDLVDFVRTEATLDAIKDQLGGKNLACWCAVGQPCHVQDVLLKIAN